MTLTELKRGAWCGCRVTREPRQRAGADHVTWVTRCGFVFQQPNILGRLKCMECNKHQNCEHSRYLLLNSGCFVSYFIAKSNRLFACARIRVGARATRARARTSKGMKDNLYPKLLVLGWTFYLNQNPRYSSFTFKTRYFHAPPPCDLGRLLGPFEMEMKWNQILFARMLKNQS